MNKVKIVVLSDTHIPMASAWLPNALVAELKEVDYIIHAGDFVTKELLDELKKIAPVYAVAGNMDEPRIKSILPSKKEIEIGNFKIGIIHGTGSPSNLHLRLRKEFDDVDIIIFGHSHKPFNEKVDGVLMFNPGTPTDKIFADKNTYGLITLNDEIKAEHVEV